MKPQKVVNLLDDADNESSKFVTRKWYVINDQSNKEYGEGNENYSSIESEAKVAYIQMHKYFFSRRYESYICCRR